MAFPSKIGIEFSKNNKDVVIFVEDGLRAEVSLPVSHLTQITVTKPAGSEEFYAVDATWTLYHGLRKILKQRRIYMST